MSIGILKEFDKLSILSAAIVCRLTILEKLWLINLLVIFLVPSQFILSLTFYGTSIYIIYLLLSKKMDYMNEIKALPFCFYGIFFIFVTLSLLWSIDQSLYKLLRSSVEIIASAIFLLWTYVVLRGEQTELILKSYLTIAIIGACISLALYGYSLNERSFLDVKMVTFSNLRLSIVTAYCYSIALIIALYYAFFSKRVVYFISAIILMFIVFMLQSRGAILASFMACNFICITFLWHKFGWKSFIILIAFLGLLYALIPAFIIEQWIERSFSHRDIIWLEAIQHIANKPFFGHGVSTIFKDQVINFSTPHNIFISLLYYYGIIGFMLFLLPVINIIYYYGKMFFYYEADTSILIACSLLVAWFFMILTEGGKIVDGAGGFLLYMFFPLAFGLAIQKKKE